MNFFSNFLFESLNARVPHSAATISLTPARRFELTFQKKNIYSERVLAGLEG